MPERLTNVYIDAFNLYYRALRGTPFKWLDLEKLCHHILPQGYQLNRIRYFTARVKSRPSDPQQAQRQQAYLRAIQTLPSVEIQFGRFLSSQIRMPLANQQPGGARTVEVIKTEEKGSDVNLATFLLCDAYEGKFEAAAVISNDTDLVLPVKLVQDKLSLQVGVISPERRKASRSLVRVASFYSKIRPGSLQASQLPTTLRDQHGTIHKPAKW